MPYAKHGHGHGFGRRHLLNDLKNPPVDRPHLANGVLTDHRRIHLTQGQGIEGIGILGGGYDIGVGKIIDMAIIEKVLSETVNHRIASWLSTHGLTCRRMSGKTDQLFLVEPLAGAGHDYGYVGKIKKVNGRGVIAAMQSGAVPVISPISADAYRDSYNVNADSAAAALAAAIHCTGLIFITDVPGVMDKEGICRILTRREALEHIDSGIIQGGMVAKMNAAFDALAKGVSAVYIVKWEGVNTLQDLAAGICRSGTILKS